MFDAWQQMALDEHARAAGQTPSEPPQPAGPPEPAPDTAEGWNAAQRGWWGHQAPDQDDTGPPDPDPDDDPAEAFNTALRRAFGASQPWS